MSNGNDGRERRQHDMILGVRAHPDLVAAREVEGPIDIVDIFRATEHVLPHVQEAIEITTKLIWMQVGVVNTEASLLAEAAGIPVMMDRCLRVAHAEGGYLQQGVIRPTLEVSLRVCPEPLQRVTDPKFGLPTLHLTSRFP